MVSQQTGSQGCRGRGLQHGGSLRPGWRPEPGALPPGSERWRPDSDGTSARSSRDLAGGSDLGSPHGVGGAVPRGPLLQRKSGPKL